MLKRPLKTGAKALRKARNGTEFPPNKSRTSSRSSSVFSSVFKKQLFSFLKFLLPCQQPTSGCPPPPLLKELDSPPWPQICPTCFYSGLPILSSEMMAPRLSIAQYSEWGKDPNVLSCEGKEGGKAKINKAFCKNPRRNDSESLLWFVQLFF